MKTFPMFIKVENRRVVIVGGGEEAAQKTRLMLKTEAKVVVAAKKLNAELTELAKSGRIIQHFGRIDVDLLSGAVLVFVASGNAADDVTYANTARAAGALVNTVDVPELCDAYTPSLVDRDPVVVAIGTEGAAPVLARQIKTRIEEFLEPKLGEFARFSGGMRQKVAENIAPADRRKFWRWVFHGTPRRDFARGDMAAAVRAIEQAVNYPVALRSGHTGNVSVVAAPRHDPDLISLRGVKRLQEADVILFDGAIADGLLELARRDAERVNVGSITLPQPWSQDRINRMMLREARNGRAVVRLAAVNAGNNAGRSEVEACDAAGIAYDFVPCAEPPRPSKAPFNEPATVLV